MEASEKTLRADVAVSGAALRDDLRAARDDLQADLRDGLARIGERVDAGRDAAALMASRDDVRSLEERVGQMQFDLGRITSRLDQIAASAAWKGLTPEDWAAATWEGVEVPAEFEVLKERLQPYSAFIVAPTKLAVSPDGGAEALGALRTLVDDGVLTPIEPALMQGN